MASPPYQSATSPPAPSPLALPRQRPSLALPSSIKSRKPSISSAASSSHPLRQASYPPLGTQHQRAEDDALAKYSPDGDGSLDEFSDSEITSAISGPVGDEAFTRKRKRGEKRARGRPPKNQALRRGSVSLVNGEDGGSTPATTNRRGGTAGAQSVVTGEADEEDEDEEDDEEAAAGGRATAEGFMDAAELDRENQRRYLFREAVPAGHQNRYDAFNKVKLKTPDIRRLINATLSQSVPQNVVTVAGAYTKMFAGILIETAREVQAEWMAAQPERPNGSVNPAFTKLQKMHTVIEEDDDRSEPQGDVSQKISPEGQDLEDSEKTRDNSSPDGDRPIKEERHEMTVGTVQATPNRKVNGESMPQNGHQDSDTQDGFKNVQPGAWGLSKSIEECDRGPLHPNHLREALRRYKKARSGGTVGFTGLSLEGKEVAAPRMGGKRLFR